MKVSENKIELNFYKYFGGASIRLGLLVSLGLFLSFTDLIYQDYWYISWLMVSISLLLVLVFFTSKVVITKDDVFFKSIIKKVTLRTVDIESSGFIRQPLGILQRQRFKEVSSYENIGFFAIRLFYFSTEEDFQPSEVANVTPSLIYFECNLKESEEILKFLDTRSSPIRQQENEDVIPNIPSLPQDTPDKPQKPESKKEGYTQPTNIKNMTVVTRAHLKNAVDNKDWDLLDLLLETDNSRIDDNSLFTDDWGDWWGMLMQCIFTNKITGVHILLKHGVNTSKGSWGDGIAMSPLEAAEKYPKILALLKGDIPAEYNRSKDVKLPELTEADLELIKQGENKDKNGFFFNT